ncbi:hypothetical protein OS493_012330 [Desmophyllum pertusum]|uniref:Uncharacterized protein n=1 Tax=Desmophyllum pertusum TaxID=174260 RepID=A0A9W9ZQL7_9CNID|nr:hypothetical protein OS493_012330 [Desmophyllum pertusum]
MIKARGCPRTESNELCRICNLNLRLTYGNCGTKSCVNLFKPSTRKESSGVVWSATLKNVGFTVVDSLNVSQLMCNGCFRKFLSKHISSEPDKENTAENTPAEDICEGAKRKFCSVLSPARSSPPNRKTLRTQSPAKERQNKSRKSLGFDGSKDGKLVRAVHSNVLSKCNIDDMDNTQGAAVKVVICWPNGEVAVKNTLDQENQSIIRNLALENWKTAVNACFRHVFPPQVSCPGIKRSFCTGDFKGV